MTGDELLVALAALSADLRALPVCVRAPVPKCSYEVDEVRVAPLPHATYLPVAALAARGPHLVLAPT